MMMLPTQGGVFGLPTGLPCLTVWRNHRHLLWHLHHGNHLRPRVDHICYFCTEGQDKNTTSFCKEEVSEPYYVENAKNWILKKKTHNLKS